LQEENEHATYQLVLPKEKCNYLRPPTDKCAHQ
jgi:hypothetical protein